MILNWLIIIWIIIFSTFLQKYYFVVLEKIKNSSKVSSIIFGFIIRFWVIIHEFCHLIFGFLSWNKIKEVRLFDKNWWKVVYETKNYIWALSQNWHNLNFIFFLILNQIWLFLTSIWPLVFWIWLTYFLVNYFLVLDYSILLNILLWWFFVILYSIFIPSFVLSYQDLSIFMISKQDWILATIFWSLINSIIFLSFIFSFSNFLVEYFIYFWVVFLWMFLIQSWLYLTILTLKYLTKKTTKA